MWSIVDQGQPGAVEWTHPRGSEDLHMAVSSADQHDVCQGSGRVLHVGEGIAWVEAVTGRVLSCRSDRGLETAHVRRWCARQGVVWTSLRMWEGSGYQGILAPCEDSFPCSFCWLAVHPSPRGPRATLP